GCPRHQNQRGSPLPWRSVRSPPPPPRGARGGGARGPPATISRSRTGLPIPSPRGFQRASHRPLPTHRGVTSRSPPRQSSRSSAGEAAQRFLRLDVERNPADVTTREDNEECSSGGERKGRPSVRPRGRAPGAVLG